MKGFGSGHDPPQPGATCGRGRCVSIPSVIGTRNPVTGPPLHDPDLLLLVDTHAEYGRTQGLLVFGWMGDSVLEDYRQGGAHFDFTEEIFEFEDSGSSTGQGSHYTRIPLVPRPFALG